MHCGTAPGQGLPPELIERARNYTGWQTARSVNGIRYIKVKATIASMPGPGGDAATKADVQWALQQTNIDFLPGNIQFVLCDDIAIVENAAFFPLGNQANLQATHTPGYINITIAGGIYDGNIFLSGVAFTDHIVLSGPNISGARMPHLLSHEIGHVLRLYHTHEIGFGVELANGSNCTTAGDLICDTPASPDLSNPGMVNVTTCTYTGMLNDPNNQPYNPPVNNIMSYAPQSCINSFTVQQFNVMNFILDSFRLYYPSTYSPVTIDPFPSDFCPDDNSIITLSASPSGGTFTGSNIINNTIDLSLVPSGIYSVTYTPPSVPDTARSIIDQSYNDRYTGMHIGNEVNYFGTIDTSQSLWQSFTAQLSGEMEAVDFRIHNLSGGNFTYSIYQGTGTGGTLLYTGTVFVPASTTFKWTSFPVPTLINTVPGNVYTAAISSAGSFRHVLSSNNLFGFYFAIYTGGTSNTANVDTEFREWVKAVPQCQSAISYYQITQPPVTFLKNSASYYCITDSARVLTGNLPSHIRQHILIDGQRDSLLNPQALGTGTHTAAYVFAFNYGCVDTTFQTFEVNDGVASFSNLVNPACSNLPPYTVVANPPGGTLLIDGNQATQFDAASLGIGWHWVEYINNQFIDTLSVRGDSCCVPYNTPSSIISLRPAVTNSTIWQSFKSNHTGDLTDITVYFSASNVSAQYAVKVYQGIGVGGTLLYSDTSFVITGSGNFSLFRGPVLIPLNTGQNYTFALTRLPVNISIGNHFILTSENNNYTEGYGNFNSDSTLVDLFFTQYMDAYTGCVEYAGDSVLVDVCTAITENNSTSITVLPNPANTQLQINSSDNSLYTYELFDNAGRRIISGSVSGSVNMDTSHIDAGHYILIVRTTTSQSFRKILIQH